MEKKRILIASIIVAICLIALIIIFGKLSKYKKEQEYNNMTFSEVINSLSEDEKETLRAIKDGDMSAVEMPQKIKDIILPPSFEKGLDKLFNR